MNKENAKQLTKEFGIAVLVWALLLVAILFASAAEEFTYAMF